MRHIPGRSLASSDPARLNLLRFCCVTSAQQNTWQIDSDHSYAWLSAGVSADSNFTLGAARVSGTVNLDRKEPVKSRLVLDIYPAGAHLPAVNPDGKLTIESLSDVADYTLLSFHSQRATMTRDGKLELTGDLTLTHVERAATFMPGEAYAGPVYGDPVIREVTFLVENPGTRDAQGYANQRIAISALATVTDEDFPELQTSITDTNWPPLVQDENCQMPSTVGEGYRGAVCTGTPLNMPPFRELPLAVGEDYHSPDTVLTGDKVMIAVHLEMTEEATRGSKNAGN